MVTTASQPGPQGTDLAACVRTATLAPSIHNTQPWQFHIRDNGIDVYADWRRRLDVIDPNGRQLIISVGAAIMNLRLALHQRGWASLVRVTAGPSESRHVAAVDCPGSAEADPMLDELATSMPRRHTNRQPFTPDPVPSRAADELVAAAAVEGASLDAASDSARARIVRLIHAAQAQLHDEGVYPAELNDRTRPRPAHHGLGGAWYAAETVPLRDFGMMTPRRRGRIDLHETYPTILVLSTDGDGRPDWVRAGQALERVWLTAIARGLAIAPMSQPLEIPRLRLEVTGPDPARRAQVLLLVGYAPPTTATSRRDVSEMLVDE
jgi:nitroreductase